MILTNYRLEQKFAVLLANTGISFPLLYELLSLKLGGYMHARTNRLLNF